MLRKSERRRKIVAAVVALGQSLGSTTIAEVRRLTTGDGGDAPWRRSPSDRAGSMGSRCPPERSQSLVAPPREAPPARLLPQRMRQRTRMRAGSLEELAGPRSGSRSCRRSTMAPRRSGLHRSQPQIRELESQARRHEWTSDRGAPGKTVREMIPELFPRVEQHIRRALGGESIPGVEVTKPASGANPGSTILLSYEPARDEAGEVVGVSVALADATSLRRAESARRETEEHLRHMMEVMPPIPWIIDAEGRALDEPALAGNHGHDGRSVARVRLADALHPDDRQPTVDAIQASRQTGDPIDVEYRVRRPGCDWKRIRSRGAARRDAGGKIICWVRLPGRTGRRSGRGARRSRGRAMTDCAIIIPLAGRAARPALDEALGAHSVEIILVTDMDEDAAGGDPAESDAAEVDAASRIRVRRSAPRQAGVTAAFSPRAMRERPQPPRRYVIFLRPDVQPRAGWLDALLRAARALPACRDRRQQARRPRQHPAARRRRLSDRIKLTRPVAARLSCRSSRGEPHAPFPDGIRHEPARHDATPSRTRAASIPSSLPSTGLTISACA